MPRRALAVAALVVMAVAVSFFLGRMFPADSPKQKSTASSSTQGQSRTAQQPPTQRAPRRGDGMQHEELSRDVGGGNVLYTSNGLPWRCSKGDAYAKTFGESIIRQLQGRYLLTSTGHMYWKPSNTWWHNYAKHALGWLYVQTSPPVTEIIELVNPGVPIVSSEYPSYVEKLNNEFQWKGRFDFRGIPVLGEEQISAGPFVCRAYVNGNWQKWEIASPFQFWVEASIRNNQWDISWSLAGPFSINRLFFSPTPELKSLFSKPFFLLPVSASDIPQ